MGAYPEEPFDPSRMFPPRFLPDAECRAAIIAEINGLASPDNEGICPLKLARQNDQEARGRREILPTMVVRKIYDEDEIQALLERGYLGGF